MAYRRRSPYTGPALVFGTNTLRIAVCNAGGPTGLNAILEVTGGGLAAATHRVK